MLVFLVFPLSSEPWVATLDANLTLTQNAYSDNWAGSEAGSISWAANMKARAEKQLSSKLHNKNELRLAYGQTYNQDAETNEWSDPVTSTDLIDFESVVRLTLGAFVDPYASGRIETQFIDETDPDMDRWINPVLFTESIGAAKVFFKDDGRELTSRLGFAVRQNVNCDVLDTLTLLREKEVTNDAGFVFYTDFTTPIAEERLMYTSKLSVFKAFYFSESSTLEGLPNEDYWKNPDINWENTLIAHITSLVMVNLYVQLLYDKEIDTGVRFKETLGLGLTFKLPG
jgi:hypothetical protein